ncbi:TetR/AcrR family transcriptional regulator [Frankia sp. Cas3]|uniref:TetR/AcrR family transcriptional regulator n=1 Tax=Frankia sp. Cas3 TaxID=3073926 RepID=UPI002AD361E3|nr:TetR family transcriptional regulator [Frankia sp. Cas3]
MTAPAPSEQAGQGVVRSAPARPAGALSERRIVDAAIRVARRDGLDRVTMRGLARDFGVTTMAIHYHVPTRKALLRLVVDRVLDKVEALPPEGSWEDRFRVLHRMVSVVIRDCPGVADYLVHNVTPSGVRLADITTGILLDGGLDEATAVLAQRTVQSYWIGYMKLVTGFEGRPRTVAERRPDSRLDGFPVLERVAPVRAGLELDAYLEFALELLIAGIRERSAQRSPTHPATPRQEQQ